MQTVKILKFVGQVRSNIDNFCIFYALPQSIVVPLELEGAELLLFLYHFDVVFYFQFIRLHYMPDRITLWRFPFIWLVDAGISDEYSNFKWIKKIPLVQYQAHYGLQ